MRIRSLCLPNLFAVHKTYSSAYTSLNLDDAQLLRFENLMSAFIFFSHVFSRGHISSSSKSYRFYLLVTFKYVFSFLFVLSNLIHASQPASLLSIPPPSNIFSTVLPVFLKPKCMVMSLRVLFPTKTVLGDFHGLHPILQTHRALCSSGVHGTFSTQSLWFSYPLHLQSPRLFKAHPPPSCSVLGPFPRRAHSPDQSSSHLSLVRLGRSFSQSLISICLT